MIETNWLVFIILLVLDLTYSAVRSSLMNARLPIMLNLHEQNPDQVERAIAIMERPTLRVSLHAFIALMHFALAGVFWLILAGWPFVTQRPAVGVGILLIVGALVLGLEYFIQGQALQNPEVWTVQLAALGRLVDFLFTPISRVLLALIHTPAGQRSVSLVTDDELKTWVENGQSEGSLEKEERQMIYSIFHFRDTFAREIMVPRIDVLAFDVNTTLPEAAKAMSQTGHSRVPVYEESVDNVIGLLYAKDLLTVRQPGLHAENAAAPLSGDELPLNALRGMLRPAHFIPEAKKVDELLTEMQSSRIHMAVVVDEYGGMAGLVTLEDIMEEIVGEIQDEYDQAEEKLYQRVGPDEVIFHGRIDLEDFNEIMGTHFAKDSADSLGGFIYGQIGRIPAGGESIEADDVALTIEQVSSRRIRKVRARRIQPNAERQTSRTVRANPDGHFETPADGVNGSEVEIEETNADQ